MKKLALVMLFSVTCLLPAATCLDTATGTKKVVNPDGSVSYAPDGSGGGPIGLLSGLLGLGGVGSVLGNVWLAIRNRSASQAAHAAVAGFEVVKSALTPEQKAKVVEAQEAVGAKARQYVREMAHKIEGSKEA